MKKLFTCILFSFALSGISYAQDIHLSQFYNSDHLLNPAKVGDFDGDFRFTGNYRNQWREISKPISTYIVSFDKVFHYYSHEINGGIFVARDEFSSFESSVTKVLLSAGYGYTYKENKFRVGIQPGFVFKKTNLDAQTFPNQWDFDPPGDGNVGNFDPTKDNQENDLKATANYFDLDIGAQWTRKIKKIEPKIGFAVNHINRPKDTYFSQPAQRLRARKVFHAELNYYINEKLTLQPKWLWMWTTKANDMVLGTNLRHALSNKTFTSVYWGVHYRHGIKRIVDAVIPTVGFRIKKFDLGFSYDVNVSSMSKDTKRRSSFEFSIIYTGASSKSRYMTLPCDRY